MAVRLTALQDELDAGIQHEARNIIRGPDGATVNDVTESFSVGRDGLIVDRPEWLQGVMLPLMVQFTATEEGSYTFEHIVDGSSVVVPLHVIVGPAPG